MSEGPLHIAQNGAILEVTLDVPKANAISAATSRIMGQAFAAFRDDPALRVAIITGAGEKFFSAGWDLKAVGGGFELALSADMIVAADHARFSLPEIKAGTLADAATLKLPRRMPFQA